MNKLFLNGAVYLFAMLLLFIIPVTAFAEGLPSQPCSSNTMNVTAEEVSDIVTDVVGEGDVVSNLETTSVDYMVESNSLTIAIPKNEDDAIVMTTEDSTDISMGLPDVINQSGVLSDNGTVVFDSTEDDVQIAVQVIVDDAFDDDSYAVRTLITIDSVDAAHEYEFPFELSSGYSLIKDYDYAKVYSTEESACGAVFVVGKNGEIINVIEPAWAVDANQRDIPTHYEVRGNTLIQVISFDESTAFPIVADPTSHPRKTKTLFLT